ncbi:tryptophan-rich sensory protein [Candidatus Sumerlaeota bacterium]|nr:tryptophan-rich sensory protein [Candidatus Sumerlaeota bacterium]
MKRNGYIPLLVFLFLSFLAGGIGSRFTAHSVRTWYQILDKPPFNPPSWLFGPVWTVLYILIAVSGWIIWKNRQNPNSQKLLYLFGFQLFLNALWTIIFFGAHQMGWAFLDIMILTIAVGTYTLFARNVSIAASFLFVPYWLWLLFAGYLNLFIWLMNR